MVPKARLYTIAAAVLTAIMLLTWGAESLRANAPVEIEFWHAMSRRRGQKLDEIVQRFNKENPDIKVNAKFIGASDPRLGNDYNALYGKILEGLARGQAPDVSQVYENWTAQLLEIDALVPVDSFIGQNKGLSQQDINDLIPAFKDSNTFTDEQGGHHVYTLPFNKSIYVVYYNVDLFRRAGVAAPKTWDELRQAAIAVSRLGVTGLAFTPSVDIFGHYLYAYGGQYITADKQVGFGGEAGKKSLDFWVNLVHTDRAALPTLDAREMFEKGQAGMYIESTSRIGGFENVKGLNFGVMPIPSGTTTAYQFAGTNVAIYRSSSPERQLAAWRFISYLDKPEITTEWAIATGYLPVRESALHSTEWTSYVNQHPYYGVGVTALAKATVQPRVAAWESIRKILDDAMYESLSRKYQTEDAIKKATSLSNDLLNALGGI